MCGVQRACARRMSGPLVIKISQQANEILRLRNEVNERELQLLELSSRHELAMLRAEATGRQAEVLCKADEVRLLRQELELHDNDAVSKPISKRLKS